MKYRRRRTAVLVLTAVIGLVVYFANTKNQQPTFQGSTLDTTVLGINKPSELATEALETLLVKGRAPNNEYRRSQFGPGWDELTGCDVRNYILKRDLKDVVTRSDTDCTVLSGVLNDPYTANVINFERGPDTSDDVQIDHVVALSDAWQKGAQSLTYETRVLFANDGLNLLAVDGQTNQDKGGSDAASWLPPNKAYRCMYVARQIAVKHKYKLWVTEAEKTAMKRLLRSCPDQKLPVVSTDTNEN